LAKGNKDDFAVV